MKNNYQKKAALAATVPEVVMPDEVMLAMADIADAAKEGLLALAVSAGLQVMDVLMAESVTALAGPKGRHDPDRVAVRHGEDDGGVVLGGRRVPVRRPRVRSADGNRELPVAAYELFSATDLLERMAMERMLGKLSSRRYRLGLEPVGADIEASARSTSKSSVSRRFVRATERAVAELMEADLSHLDLVAVMIDGVHFAGHCCVVALGIGIDGTKHPLALEEGDTENATVVRDLLAGLRDRGLDTSRPMLFVLDGAKALRAGVDAVFDVPVVQRCQLHKIRNVEAKLPKQLAKTVTAKIRAAYHNHNALEAEAALRALAAELKKSHPGAAGSLLEGLDETLTVVRLKIPPTLRSTLRSTNAIESMIEICRDHSSNVKRWRDGDMTVRWCAAGMLEAAKQFRRVKGHLHLRALRAELDKRASVTTPAYQQAKDVA
ncbi:MAG TPA: IS256 family transposase [Vicinamibacterales bacterium]|nr:IS256 family transposase [Vicinamibacterales bacterium]